MKLKNIIKNSLFLKSFKLARNNPSKIGLMILFDVSFLVSFFYVLPIMAKYFAQGFQVAPTGFSLLIFSIFSLIYYLLVLFVYSFFKFSVLDFVKSLFEMTEFSFKRLGKFYLLNIILVLPSLFLFSVILSSIKEAYRPYAFIFLGITFFVILYIIMNITQSYFYEGASIKESLKRGIGFMFEKIKVYRETILIMALSALALWLLFLGIGYLIRLATSNNYNLYLTSYSYFRQTSVFVFDIVFYMLILINRISFYAIAREGK